MIQVTEATIDAMAANAQAAANGKGLVKKRSFSACAIDPDGTILSAACAGSGAEPYRVSVDFIDPAKPVARCSCPSRQQPCKHALGLLYHYASGAKFGSSPVPADVLEKRAKLEAKEEKAKKAATEPAAPKKTNTKALGKKIEAQREGLDALRATVLEIGVSGFASLTPERLEALEAQAARLGDTYLPGPEAFLRGFVRAVERARETDGTKGDPERDAAARRAMAEELARLRSLCAKGLERLAARLADPEHKLDPESTIDELLGHAWQLSELADAGLARKDARLVQLSFDRYLDEDRKEYVDSGLWVDVSSTERARTILETRNLRPVKAAKHLKEDDSCFTAKLVPELAVYPGGLNPRARWDGATDDGVSAADRSVVLESAALSLPDALKAARAQFKNALLPRQPVLLVRFSELERLGDSALLLDSGDGNVLVLDDRSGVRGPAAAALADFVSPRDARDGAALVRFGLDAASRRVEGRLLSIVNADRVVRLAY